MLYTFNIEIKRGIYMDKEAYVKWVDYIYKNGCCRNKKLIEDFNDWRNRMTAAQFLIQLDKYEEAIDLLKSVDEVSIDNEGDIELKAWSLYILAHCIVKMDSNLSEGLKYIEKSLVIAESTDHSFNFITRGEIFRGKLNMMLYSSGKKSAIEEADKKIESIDETYSISNSYLFNAYSFKSSIEYTDYNVEKACEYMKKALQYFPKKYNDIKIIKEIWENRGDNYEKAYIKLLEFTHNHVSWDI